LTQGKVERTLASPIRAEDAACVGLLRPFWREDFMRRSASMLVSLAIALGAVSLAGHVSAQGPLKAQLVGSWTFVSGGSTDSSGRPVWGEGAKGLLIFLENGRYSSQLMRGDLPKFGSGSRLQGTPEENKAIVQGSVSSYGTYTVDEGKKAFTIKWEAHTFPNMTDQSQTRSFAITGDELRIQNPGPTAGGPPSELVYRRDK
jgi:Lipocalin-like domain